MKVPQTQNTGNLAQIIKSIPDRGVPDKINLTYLQGLGFKSSNDRSIPTVLKHIGIIDSVGQPTENYRSLRDRVNGPKVMANLVRKAYYELFQLYPDAQNRDQDSLKNFFTTKTTGGPASVKNIVSTFLALCGCSDFSSEFNIEDSEVNVGNAGTMSEVKNQQQPMTQGRGVVSASRQMTEPEIGLKIYIIGKGGINVETPVEEEADLELVKLMLERYFKKSIKHSSEQNAELE